MKKVLCIMLAVVMLSLTLTGCSSSMKGTKLYESYEILEGGDFYLEIEIEEAGMDPIIVQRRGNSIFSDMMGVHILIIDKRMYDLDISTNTATYLDLTDEEFNKQLDAVTDVTDAFIQVTGSKLVNTGRSAFQGVEREYEEVEHGKGKQRSRAFFDENGELLGFLMQQIDDGPFIEVSFRLSANIDESLFALPEGCVISPGVRP
jgi:hypothetical protein